MNKNNIGIEKINKNIKSKILYIQEIVKIFKIFNFVNR